MVALSITALVAILPLLASAAPRPVKRATYQYIHPGGDTTKCLVVPRLGDDVATTIEDCTQAHLDPTTSYLWDISFGDNPSLQLSQTGYCLDAGTGPHNNGPAKIYTCISGVAAQDWYYTNDNRIAITGGNQCLDLGSNGPQTYQCTPGNTNQVWVAGASPYGPGSTTVVSTSTKAVTTTAVSSTPVSTTAVTTTTAAAPAATGQLIHPGGNSTLCLTVNNGYAGVGTNLVIVDCLAPTDSFASLQRFNINRGSGAVQLVTPALCLDAGSTPANGNVAKIYTCYPGLFQQTYYFTDDGRIAVQGGNQCLDVRAESGPTQTAPLGSLKDVQFWQCTTGDDNQYWTVSS